MGRWTYFTHAHMSRRPIPTLCLRLAAAAVFALALCLSVQGQTIITCCLPSGSCLNLTITTCVQLGGHDVGACAACQPSGTSGACCAQNGSCILSSQTSCTSPSSFLGNGTACSAAACNAPGACCRASGCFLAPITQCAGSLSNFVGPSTICASVSGGPATPCCIADYDRSGSITVSDLFSFLAAYFSGQTQLADTNADGRLSIQDVFNFIDVYMSGC